MKKILFAGVAVAALAAAVPGNAATIMIKGSNNNSAITTFLEANGHTVIANSEDYSGVDGVILLRTNGTAQLSDYVSNGGRLVTEWTGADWAMANLLGGAVSGGGFVGSDTVVSFTTDGAAFGLGDGVGSSYSAGPASQFFRDFSDIGTGSVFATRPGDVAAIVGGAAGSGFVVANGIDWADSFGSAGADNQQVLLNSLFGSSMGGAVPEPATWAMMLLGFFGLGAAMRRKPAVKTTVSYA